MKAERIFIVLFVAGTVLPLSAFLPWFSEHGFDAPLFIEGLFANPISSFFAWDVFVSALATLAFIWIEGKRLSIKRLWAPSLACLCVGVSSGLPLFLWMRSRQLDRNMI